MREEPMQIRYILDEEIAERIARMLAPTEATQVKRYTMKVLRQEFARKRKTRARVHPAVHEEEHGQTGIPPMIDLMFKAVDAQAFGFHAFVPFPGRSVPRGRASIWAMNRSEERRV